MEDVKVDPQAEPWRDIGGLFGHAFAIWCFTLELLQT